MVRVARRVLSKRPVVRLERRLWSKPPTAEGDSVLFFFYIPGIKHVYTRAVRWESAVAFRDQPLMCLVRRPTFFHVHLTPVSFHDNELDYAIGFICAVNNNKNESNSDSNNRRSSTDWTRSDYLQAKSQNVGHLFSIGCKGYGMVYHSSFVVPFPLRAGMILLLPCALFRTCLFPPIEMYSCWSLFCEPSTGRISGKEASVKKNTIIYLYITCNTCHVSSWKVWAGGVLLLWTYRTTSRVVRACGASAVGRRTRVQRRVHRVREVDGWLGEPPEAGGGTWLVHNQVSPNTTLFIAAAESQSIISDCFAYHLSTLSCCCCSLELRCRPRSECASPLLSTGTTESFLDRGLLCYYGGP